MELREYLQNLPADARLIVTVPRDASETYEQVRKSIPHAEVIKVANVGRDIWPFLVGIRSVNLDDFDYICKIHTKKSPHTNFGYRWRTRLLRSILGSRERTDAIFRAFSLFPELGMVCCDRYVGTSLDRNGALYADFCHRLGITRFPIRFASGTMFISRADIWKSLKEERSFNEDCFVVHAQTDGQPEHALERVFGALVRSCGYTIGGCDVFCDQNITPANSTTFLDDRASILAGSGGVFDYEWKDGEIRLIRDKCVADDLLRINSQFCLRWSQVMGFTSVVRTVIGHVRCLRNLWRNPRHVGVYGRPLLLVSDKRHAVCMRIFLFILFLFLKERRPTVLWSPENEDASACLCVSETATGLSIDRFACSSADECARRVASIAVGSRPGMMIVICDQKNRPIDDCHALSDALPVILRTK